MDENADEILKEIERVIDSSSRLSFLLGAGISRDANVPLMGPLTNKVYEDVDDEEKRLIDALKGELPPNANIEDILTHLADYLAIARRSNQDQITINEAVFDKNGLSDIHDEILSQIAYVIRGGFWPGDRDYPEREGTPESPIVDITEHLDFIESIYGYSRSGIGERRSPVCFFTLNYDTLLEDALAINKIPYWDGFAGGAVAFRDHRFGESINDRRSPGEVVKLHGSIDWFVSDGGDVWRARANDTYPELAKRVLIYPQATKYQATQKDPFASQFDILRRTMKQPNDNTLVICGYGFGDEHVNDEIESEFLKDENKTTVVALISGRDDEGEVILPSFLERIRSGVNGNRVFVLTENGVYRGERGPVPYERDGFSDIWKFSGLTRLIRNGAE